MAEKKGVSVRPCPFPYRAMLAISSDIDDMTPARFRRLHRFLNTLEETEMGAGLGLDIADSLWFYSPSSGAGEEGQISYFDSLDWRRPSRHSAELLHYVGAGWIDTIHAYGDWTGVSDRDARFTRRHAEQALAALDSAGLRLRVWTNHGDKCNVQNVGTHKYMNGDLTGSEAYHWDLARAAGIEFVWSHERPFDCGEASPLTPMKARDGSVAWGFPRFHYASFEDAAADGLMLPVARQIRRDRPFVPLWHPRHLHVQLTERRLASLIENSQMAVVAQHLGSLGPLSRFGADAIAALRRLKSHQDGGQILVSGTRRLLDYNRSRDHVRYNVIEGEDHLIIDILGVEDPVAGWLAPELEQVRGLTFQLPDGVRAELRLGGAVLEPGHVTHGTSPEGDRSIGVRWFAPDHTDHTADVPGARPMNPVAGAADPRRRELGSFLEGLEPSGARRTRLRWPYARGYAIDAYAHGLESYGDRLRSLGFNDRSNGLDIGCGPGQWSLAFVRDNQEVVGIDAEPAFVQIARQVADELGLAERARFKVGRAEHLRFDAAAFDAVWCHGVLMFADAELSMREVSRVLAPGGLFYCGYSSLGLRLDALRRSVVGGRPKVIKVQLSHLLGHHLYRVGLYQAGFSKVRALSLEELVSIADVYGLTFLDRPGLQDLGRAGVVDGNGSFLGLPTTVDLIARRDEGINHRTELLGLGAGDELLARLDGLLAGGCPHATADVLRRTYGDMRSASGAPRRLFLRALIKCGRDADAVVDDLAAQEDDPLTIGLLAHQRGRLDEALDCYTRLEPGDEHRRFLLGVALMSVGRFDEAQSSLRLGVAERPNEIGCRIALMFLSLEQGDLAAVRSDLCELLRMVGQATGANEEADTVIAAMAAD